MSQITYKTDAQLRREFGCPAWCTETHEPDNIGAWGYHCAWPDAVPPVYESDQDLLVTAGLEADGAAEIVVAFGVEELHLSRTRARRLAMALLAADELLAADQLERHGRFILEGGH